MANQNIYKLSRLKWIAVFSEFRIQRTPLRSVGGSEFRDKSKVQQMKKGAIATNVKLNLFFKKRYISLTYISKAILS
ncbi:MAG: hypothetical protein AB4426_13125 [Xenococcaceae cyanobacterium]